MQKIKHKFWVLLAGIAMFAAVFLLTGMASGTQASAASAEEVCVHEYERAGITVMRIRQIPTNTKNLMAVTKRRMCRMKTESL